MDSKKLPILLTQETARTVLGVKRGTYYKLVRKGVITRVTFEGKKWVASKDLYEVVEKLKKSK